MRLGCLNGAGECNRVIKIIFFVTYIRQQHRTQLYMQMHLLQLNKKLC